MQFLQGKGKMVSSQVTTAIILAACINIAFALKQNVDLTKLYLVLLKSNRAILFISSGIGCP